MNLIAGLGNPGSKYLLTRHNIGFMVVDFIASSHSVHFKEKWKSLYSKTQLFGKDVVLQKPMTFMNLSGESVQPALQFFKIPKEELLVLHDEISMPFGALRFQKNRSPGGHNGLKDINQKLGSQDYVRLKIGVGMPSSGPVDRHVLSDFSKEEQKELSFLFNDILSAIESFLKEGLDKAANKHNRKNLPLP